MEYISNWWYGAKSAASASAPVPLVDPSPVYTHFKFPASVVTPSYADILRGHPPVSPYPLAVLPTPPSSPFKPFITPEGSVNPTAIANMKLYPDLLDTDFRDIAVPSEKNQQLTRLCD